MPQYDPFNSAVESPEDLAAGHRAILADAKRSHARGDPSATITIPMTPQHAFPPANPNTTPHHHERKRSGSPSEYCSFCHLRKKPHQGADDPAVSHSPIDICSRSNFCPDTNMHEVDRQLPVAAFDAESKLPKRRSFHRRHSLLCPSTSNDGHELQTVKEYKTARQLGQDDDSDLALLKTFSPQEERKLVEFEKERGLMESVRMIDATEEAKHHHEGSGPDGEFAKEIKMLNGGWMAGTRHYGEVIP